LRAVITQIQQWLQEAPHPWWHHLPPERQQRRHRIALLARRLLSWLKQRRQLIGVALGLYLALCLLPVLRGLPGLGLVAVLPVLLVPPVGAMIYWLVWQDYHQQPSLFHDGH